MKKFNAFTLAEVIITLGIIGVVAAITIHSLIANIEKQRNLAILKRAYSDLQNYVQRFMYDQDLSKITQNSYVTSDVDIFQNSADAFSNYLYSTKKFKKRPNSYSKTKNGTNIKNIGICNNSNRVNCLLSINGQYAYYIFNYYPDNGVYKARSYNGPLINLYILTDMKRHGYDLNNWGGAQDQHPEVMPTLGKNMFIANISVNGKVSPVTSGNYGFGGANCSKASNDYQVCLNKIIKDNWKINYDY